MMRRLRALTARCQQLEATLLAIRNGDVDGVVGTNGAGVVTLAGVDIAWRVLFDRMNEGAVTLTETGVISYCNTGFARLVRVPVSRLLGRPLRRFVPATERAAFDALVMRGCRRRARGEGTLRAANGTVVTVGLSLAPLRAGADTGGAGTVGVVTDLTVRTRAEQARRRLTRRAAAAMEDERRRIAQELHDETGQSLTALLVGLRSIEDAGSMREAVLGAQRLRGIATRTVDEVGRLARGLHPHILEDLGLAAAVSRHVRDFARIHGTRVDLRYAELGGHLVPMAVQSTLYRVLQEALTNVARHAGAGHVAIWLRRRDGVVELRVRDDGRGFDPAAYARGGRRRLGLRAMHERTALLGGSVVVESRPGGGTEVVARYPLDVALRHDRRAR